MGNSAYREQEKYYDGERQWTTAGANRFRKTIQHCFQIPINAKTELPTTLHKPEGGKQPEARGSISVEQMCMLEGLLRQRTKISREANEEAREGTFEKADHPACYLAPIPIVLCANFLPVIARLGLLCGLFCHCCVCFSVCVPCSQDATVIFQHLVLLYFVVK
ncbi:unnamed protein product [Gongylonema pulchrum]|uniref:Uncharacterized protein n=1 Tax=Gongylonema pulchrum TaxID=637853 RepID=A0A183DXS2_9BILA|nr:unnamed protein product [Gongylonema pulchrum]